MVSQRGEKEPVCLLFGNPPLCQVFSGNTFYAMGELSSTVPVLSVGGLAKEFLVPGWRVGWVMVHDKNGVFEEVRQCVSPFLCAHL